MKKIISILLCAALLLLYCIPVCAAEYSEDIDAAGEEATATEAAAVDATASDAVTTAAADAGALLELQSQSAILMEVSSGQIICEKNPDEQLRPASVTKVMTLLLIFEELDAGNMSLDDIVTVTEHAASMGGSQCFFEAGEQQTVKDMIKCIEVASGNDAAVAMAEHIAGSEQAFVDMMNSRAQELGMVNTHFENACGLEAEGHLTTARDIAIMSRELLLNHPEIKEYSTIWMDSIIHRTARGESQFDLANTNKFLNQYTGATGLKTGYTSQAKYCMSASASRNGVELVAVIMGAETKEIRNSEACKLLDYGYSRCKTYTDTDVLPDDFKVEVLRGTEKYIPYLDCESHEIVLVDKNPEEVEKQVIAYTNLEAPIHEGDIIGAVQYSYQGNLIDEVHIYAACDIEELSFLYSLKQISGKLFMAK